MSMRRGSGRDDFVFSDWRVLNAGLKFVEYAALTLVVIGLLAVIGFFATVFAMMFTEGFAPALSLVIESKYEMAMDLYFLEFLFTYAKAWAGVLTIFVSLLVLRWVFDVSAAVSSRVKGVLGTAARR